MNLPDAIRTTRWMVRDTLRQSVHTKLFWVMAAVTTVATVFCLSVDVRGDASPARLPYEVPSIVTKRQVYDIGWEWLTRDKQVTGELPVPGQPGGEPLRKQAWDRGMKEVEISGARVIDGDVTLGFGAVTAPLGRSREDAVRMIQLWLVTVVADNAGVLLALLWTAGFLPTFLEPQSATVLLAKPIPRWAILLGKYVGVVLFVSLYGAVFIGATWTALGVKTGVWFAAYWLAVPLLAVHFGVFYAVSTFLAVWTRSTVACAFGTLLFWVVCWAVNFTHFKLGGPTADGLAAGSHMLLDVGYWVLPKPLDLSGVFHTAMQAEGFGGRVPELVRAEEAGRFHPGLSASASAGFAAVTIAAASYELEMTDY